VAELKAITAEEMKKIELGAKELGISPLLLMENAGKAVAEAAEKLGGKRVVIFASTGNNGGDGFVAARHLAASGVKVEIFMLGDPGSIRTEEASLNWKIVRNLKSVRVTVLKTPADVQKIRNRLEVADVVIDAMLGTGVRGELREPLASAVKLINGSRVPVLAVDVPTGIDPSTGEVCGEAVRATRTVTFHRLKAGLLKAKKYTGRIEVVSIGIPSEANDRALRRVPSSKLAGKGV
jgi:NAD(P)H-hydrate epimerase